MKLRLILALVFLAASSVQIYRGTNPVYRERICIATGMIMHAISSVMTTFKNLQYRSSKVFGIGGIPKWSPHDTYLDSAISCW